MVGSQPEKDQWGKGMPERRAGRNEIHRAQDTLTGKTQPDGPEINQVMQPDGPAADEYYKL